MTTSIKQSCILVLAFIALRSAAQPLIAPVMPSSQCYSSNGNSSVGSVLSVPPGAVSYSWIISASSATCQPPLVSPIMPDGSIVGIDFYCCGTYTVDCIAFDAMNTPVGNFSSTATISCLPSLTLTTQPSGSVMCSGSTTTLTASGAANYTWMPGNATTSSITATAGGCYTVISESDPGCTVQATSCLTVQSINLSVSPAAATVCAGSSATLVAAGATTYSWSTTATTNSILVTSSVSTVYTVTGSVGNCKATQTVNVSAGSNPSVNVSSSTPVLCKGNSATLTASGGVTYSWSSSSSTVNTTVISPTVTTSYTVNGKNTSGCAAKAFITQTVAACTGVESIKNSGMQVSIYPNPNSGVFTLAFQNGESARLEIYTALGQVILSQTVYPGLTEIDLGNYPAGVFQISLESSRGRSFYKVITSTK